MYTGHTECSILVVMAAESYASGLNLSRLKGTYSCVMVDAITFPVLFLYFFIILTFLSGLKGTYSCVVVLGVR